MQVSAFFNAPMLLIITYIESMLYSGINDIIYSGLVACFMVRIEHENLYRNNGKSPLRSPMPVQQYRGVVSKCSEWW